MQDVEFTVENKMLWMLQTRSGKRTAKSAIKIAHDGSEISIESKTLCVHSDTPDALVIAKAIKKKLNRS